MKQLILVVFCIGVVVHGGTVKPLARSFKSDEDYTSNPSGGGSGLYPEHTEVRYPSAVEEEPSGAEHESHPYAQSQVRKLDT